MRKPVLFILITLCLVLSTAHAQRNQWQKQRLPVLALKTNLLYGATTTPNLGLELRLSRSLTFDFVAGFNPWTFKDNKKLKNILFQPELRFWTGESFNGHYFGLHALYVHYNISGVKLPFGIFPYIKDYRFQGNTFGAGFSYGYQFMLSGRFSMECNLGLGYTYSKYEKFNAGHNGYYIDKEDKHLFGLTKLGLTLIYIIK